MQSRAYAMTQSVRRSTQIVCTLPVVDENKAATHRATSMSCLDVQASICREPLQLDAHSAIDLTTGPIHLNDCPSSLMLPI